MDLIVNRIRMDMVRSGDMMSMEDVTDILGIPILGAIPDDEEIVISTNQGEPLVGMNSFAGQAYLNICKRILGQEVPLMGLEKNKGFFHMFSGLLKTGINEEEAIPYPDRKKFRKHSKKTA